MEYKVPKTFSGKMLFEKLQVWRQTNLMTLDAMCKKLGWHSQQLYAMNGDNRMVRAKTVIHVSEKLGIDMGWLLSGEGQASYIKVFENYPPKVLEWLVSEEGKAAMLKAYGIHSMEEAQKELAAEAKQVYEAVG